MTIPILYADGSLVHDASGRLYVIAQRTVRLEILHNHAPRKDRWRQQLTEALQTAQDVAQVVAIVAPLIFT